MAILEEPVKGIKTVKNYINGEWVDSKGEMVDVVNPATFKTIARVPVSTKEEFDAAVAAAKAAYPDWRRTTPLARSRMLFRLKALMEENFEEISRIQKNLANYVKIRKFVILNNPFSLETGEITPSMKVKRKTVEEKYQELIEKMYESLER